MPYRPVDGRVYCRIPLHDAFQTGGGRQGTDGLTLRCVSVMSSGVWGSAYYAYVHLAVAKSHDIVEITTAS